MGVRKRREVRDKEMQEEKEVYMEGKGLEGCGKYAGGGIWSGHAQQDFGIGNAGQNGKYGKFKEVREEKEVRESETRHKQNNNRRRGNRKESKSS